MAKAEQRLRSHAAESSAAISAAGLLRVVAPMSLVS
jgi:hypothetical protein